MSFTGLLRHTLVVEHPATGPEDSWGHDPSGFSDGDTVKGLVQDRRGSEITVAGGLGGTVVTDTLVFLPAGTVITEQDRLRRVDTAAEYEVLFVKDAAGQGHHLEVVCRWIKVGTEPGS